MSLVKKSIAWVSALQPVRVVIHFVEHRGFLLAAGLSFQSIFAVFAGIWVGFATAGLILKGNTELSNAFFTTLARSVPGLLTWNGTQGVVDPEQLLQVEILSWTGGAAAVGLLFTAVGWLSSARDAIRALFELPGERLNFFLLKLKDLGLTIGLGVALLVSSAFAVVGSQLLETIFTWLDIGEDSPLTVIAGRATAFALMFVLDTIILVMLYRVLSGLKIPVRRLMVGSMLGATGLGILKFLGTALLGGAGRNPLLASFTIIIGLLIWFNLICVVILLSASWIAVGMSDAGIAADPKIAAERAEADRLERKRLEAERAALAAEQRSWVAKLFRRPPRP